MEEARRLEETNTLYATADVELKETMQVVSTGAKDARGIELAPITVMLSMLDLGKKRSGSGEASPAESTRSRRTTRST
jgi:hypothetical protein